jgi:hypothetical protein
MDYKDTITFISNTDPVTYTPDIKCAKLYDSEVNVDNDILSNYERMKTLIDNTDITSFYKGYIKKDINTGNIEIEWRDLIYEDLSR